MIVKERKIDDTIISNQNDHPVTISRKHIMIAGETFLIAEKTFLIFDRPGSNEDESVDHFIKTITIVGTHKSISAKIKNDFAKEKNQNDLSVNQSCEDILQEAGNKLQTRRIILSSAGNVFQEDEINIIIPGNKLKEARSSIQKAKGKLKEDERNLKNLGKGLIFVETFRENGKPVFPFRIANFGFRNGEPGNGGAVLNFYSEASTFVPPFKAYYYPYLGEM